MARPAKSVNIKTGTITKEAEVARRKVEQQLKGDDTLPKCPKYLNSEIKKLFKIILNWVKKAGIVSAGDEFMIENLANTIYHLREINKMLQDEPDYYFDGTLMGNRSKLVNEMNKGCVELCLSPQARAKIGCLLENSTETEAANPLNTLMEDDDEW